jgi:hypothetical protein
MRVFPSADYIITDVQSQLRRLLRSTGFGRVAAETTASAICHDFHPIVSQWVTELPSYLQLHRLRPALRHVHDAGMLFLKVDRNPQRVILLCRDLWLQLHRETFLTSRYEVTTLPASVSDPTWASSMCESFRSAFRAKGLAGKATSPHFWCFPAEELAGRCAMGAGE